MIVAGVTTPTLCAFLELLVAHPLPGWLYAGVVAVFGLAVLVPGSPKHRPERIVTFTTVAAVLATLHFVEWNTRKPFLRDLRKVQAGMTEAEVRHIMARYVEGTGWPASPFSRVSTPGDAPGGQLVIPGSLVFRHSDDARFNSDWGVVSFAAGKVAKVEFNAD